MYKLHYIKKIYHIFYQKRNEYLISIKLKIPSIYNRMIQKYIQRLTL